MLSEAGAPGLTRKQIAIIALASAIAVAPRAADRGDRRAGGRHAERRGSSNGARAAAAIMAMNNIYYRFTHLVGEPEYATLRAGLRMNVMANPGCDKIDFELALARRVGDQRLRHVHGFAREDAAQARACRRQAIQSAVRIAAVLHAVAVTAEQAAAAAA